MSGRAAGTGGLNAMALHKHLSITVEKEKELYLSLERCTNRVRTSKESLIRYISTEQL